MQLSPPPFQIARLVEVQLPLMIISCTFVLYIPLSIPLSISFICAVTPKPKSKSHVMPWARTHWTLCVSRM